jgi:hypothetical protein
VTHALKRSGSAAGVLLVATVTFAACSDSGPRASEEFCSLGRDAVRWYIDFDDDQAVAALIEHPSLDDEDRAAVSAAVEDARAQLAGGSGWSNDRMTEVVNDICDLNLTAVTMVP